MWWDVFTSKKCYRCKHLDFEVDFGWVNMYACNKTLDIECPPLDEDGDYCVEFDPDEFWEVKYEGAEYTDYSDERV